MNCNHRHGKAMTSYEETIMDLLIKVEESERYLQRYHEQQKLKIKVENGDEERYPSFSIKAKEKELIEEKDKVNERNEVIFDVSEHDGMERYTVKLTAWEWLEARKSGIMTLILSLSALFLQIYISWSSMMDEVSTLILKGMKYGCIVGLVLKLAHWIRSGELHQYLNEEV